MLNNFRRNVVSVYILSWIRDLNPCFKHFRAQTLVITGPRTQEWVTTLFIVIRYSCNCNHTQRHDFPLLGG